MRLEKAVFHNIGPFEHAEIDLESLGPDCRLVALRGVNGAGKTFSLQAAIAGAAYRKMPTQGTLVARARARDSYVESTLVNGARWVVRHDLDAVSRKGEATVRDAAGEPAYKGTSVKLFDAWSAKHFTAQDVLFATSFAVQKSGGFVDLGSAERISVILQVVGVSRIERMAAGARESAKSARHEFEKLDARLADERARCGELTALGLVLAEVQARVVACDAAVADARVGLDVAVDDAKAVEEQAMEHAAWAEKRAALETDLAAARKTCVDLETRVRNNLGIQAEGDAIRAAVARMEVLGAELTATEQQIASHQAQVSAAAAADRVHEQRYTEARQRLERAKIAATKGPSVRTATNSLSAAEQAVEIARAELEAATGEIESLSGRTLAGADERIKSLRHGLTMICELDDNEDIRAASVIAENHVDLDDDAVEAATETPKLLTAARTRLALARQTLAAAEKTLATTTALAAQLPAVEAAELELDAARAEIERLRAESVETTRQAGETQGALDAHTRAADDLRAELVRVRPVAIKAEPLSRAEARLAELEPQLDAARADVARLEAQGSSATPAPPPPMAAPDVAAYRSTLERAEREARTAHSSVAVAEERLAAAQESHARLVTLQTETDAAAAELADWNRLAADFGRDGLQSAEVDSAGPDLTDLTNDLLRTCHGPQFTVSIETSRLSADGKDLVDECRVQVIDSVAGREGEAREFSGGQSVIIGEAISLALTMLACNRAGLTGITLVRDESGAALDPVAGRAYVKMLRRAADFVSASRVLLVTHSQECAEMCDARILIQDGKVSYA